jgi:hypothetical protein
MTCRIAGTSAREKADRHKPASDDSTVNHPRASVRASCPTCSSVKIASLRCEPEGRQKGIPRQHENVCCFRTHAAFTRTSSSLNQSGGEFSLAHLCWQGRPYRIFHSPRPNHRTSNGLAHKKISSQHRVNDLTGRVETSWRITPFYRSRAGARPRIPSRLSAAVSARA